MWMKITKRNFQTLHPFGFGFSVPIALNDTTEDGVYMANGGGGLLKRISMAMMTERTAMR